MLNLLIWTARQAVLPDVVTIGGDVLELFVYDVV